MLIVLSLHCKHILAVHLQDKYLGDIRREEGRLLATLGETGGTAGPRLGGLGLEVPAGGLPERAGRAGEPEGMGSGTVQGGGAPGCVTV